MANLILPQPPSKNDPGFDDWMFRLWKAVIPAASASGAGIAVWNDGDKSAALAIYNGQLSAQGDGTANWRDCRATKGFTRGKWFWEVTVIATANTTMIGIMNASGALTGGSAYPGGDTNGYGYFPDGKTYYNAAASAYGNSYTAADVIGVAVDMDAGALYFYKNGTIQNSGTAAATGISGTFYPAVGCYNTGAVTANFGQVPFRYSVPAGYRAGVIY